MRGRRVQADPRDPADPYGRFAMTHVTSAVWPRSQVLSSQYIPPGIDFLHSVRAVAFKDL